MDEYKMSKDINLLGFNVTTKSIINVVSESLQTEKTLVVNTINPHSYVEQKSDPEFKEALLNSDILVPDGSGIVLAAKFLKNKEISKIAGYDLFSETMKQLNKMQGKVFFLGSSDDVLNKMLLRAKDEYPCVKIEILSPPFKPQFDIHDLKSFTDSINAFHPDVVFVGLTAPKQEKLIFILRNMVDTKYFSGIGAVFDFYAGTVKRPAKIWLTLHLEWLIRFIGEPKRLWRRNFVSSPIFLIDLIIFKYFRK
jgi:N-acetylglucosaminyldiphosphoundecaprenol N-acetyl-beta-D-mannosaminyltransferase